MQTDLQSDRLYFLDWLRVFGMSCVFLFHNARFFDLIDWEVKNKETYLGITIFVMFVNFWIMPLFFMLAGASTNFALKTKTMFQYIRARYWRLVIPYMFGIVVLIPPQKYVESLDKGRFLGSFLEFLPWYYRHNLLSINFGFDPTWFGHFGKHLWFLGFLFLFSLLVLPIICYSKSQNGSKLMERFAVVGEKIGGIYLFILPLSIVQIILRPMFPKYPSWTDFIYWFLIFLMGYIFFSDKRFIEKADRYKYVSLVSGLILLVALIILFNYFLEYLKVWWDHPNYSLGCIFFHMMWAAATWFWLMFFLGFSKVFLDFKNKWLSKWNEAVMPFYMLHQTIILVIGFQVIQWPIGVLLKYVVVSLVSLVIIAFLYYFGIIKVNLLRTVFGMKPFNYNGISSVNKSQIIK
jgi:glucan biosynthesis protein C